MIRSPQPSSRWRMKIKGISNIEIEDKGNGKYKIVVNYTTEFEDIVKIALDKKRVSKKESIDIN